MLSESKHAILAAHDHLITSVGVQDGHIFSEGNEGRVKSWELKTGDVIQVLGTKAEVVWKVAFGEAEVKNVVVASMQGAAFLDISEPMITFFGFSYVAKTDTSLVLFSLISARLV